MFEFLRYKKELRRIRKVQKTVAKKYERDLEGANKRGGDAYELQMIDQYYLGNDAEGDHWINWIHTRHLQTICQDLIIPMPDSDDPQYFYEFNFDDDQGSRKILTTAGINLVRNRIRDERKSRRDAFGFWIAAITGIIGALIGLASVLKH